MNTVITLLNKKTHVTYIVSGLHVPIAEPSVVEISIDSMNDIDGFSGKVMHW